MRGGGVTLQAQERSCGGSCGGCGDDGRRRLLLFLFTLVTGPRRSFSLKLSDTEVYGPQMRAGRRGALAGERCPAGVGGLISHNVLIKWF